MIFSLKEGIWNRVSDHFGLKIVSLLLAMMLWVVVMGSKTVEISKEVPVEIQLNDDQVLLEGPPERVTYKLVGPKAFLRSAGSKLDEPIRINVEKQKTGMITHRLYSDALKLPFGVRVASISPNVVTFRVEELRRKSVPVRLELNGKLPDGHRLIRSELNQNTVRIRGPRNKVGLVQQLVTLPIDLTNMRDSNVVPINFDLEGMGIELDGPNPELGLEIQAKGVAFRLRDVPVRIKSTNKASLSEEKVSVIVRVDRPGAKIESEKVIPEIDVRDYPVGEYNKWVKVTLPEGVHLVRVVPALVRVSVRK